MSVFSPNKDELNERVVDYFNDRLPEQKAKNKGKKHEDGPEDIVLVASVTLVALHLVVLIKRRLIPFVSDIHTDYLPLGMG